MEAGRMWGIRKAWGYMGELKRKRPHKAAAVEAPTPLLGQRRAWLILKEPQTQASSQTCWGLATQGCPPERRPQAGSGVLQSPWRPQNPILLVTVPDGFVLADV